MTSTAAITCLLALGLTGAPGRLGEPSLPFAHAAQAESRPDAIALERAVVVTASDLSIQERTAVRVLVEEVERRTAIRLAGLDELALDERHPRHCRRHVADRAALGGRRPRGARGGFPSWS